MQIEGKVVVVTGGARGIGAAMSRRFGRERALLTIVSDIDIGAAEEVASAIRTDGSPATAMRADVSKEADVIALVEAALGRHGRIDVFCSNAGIMVSGGPGAPDRDWQAAWSVNVMAHVYAARAALPAMLAAGSGYFLNTCSAAGLLTSLGAAPYAATKHAAVSFAEWMAITYGPQGIRVSALCPQTVNTEMLRSATGGIAAASVRSGGDVLEPDDVAQMVIDGLAAEKFLILTHPEVTKYVSRKAGDVDRWISGMQRLLAGPA